MTAVLAALVMALGAGPAQSASTHNCSLSEADAQPSSGKPEYNQKLTQKASSCTTAKKVMKSFHSCRSRTGIKCTHKVRTNWTCTSKKTLSSSTQFYATTTCKWGARVVKISWVQAT
ncbi:MAG: hypothetical protein QOG15_2970 [Solirubrobacteraceae bacterium]|nr:hypothetical protein [Solirubrobacteraceae bacterium]